VCHEVVLDYNKLVADYKKLLMYAWAPVAPDLGDHKYGNSNTSIRACVRCGTPAVDEDDLFCRRCGESMPPASAPAA
jgi:hypothetical protein